MAPKAKPVNPIPQSERNARRDTFPQADAERGAARVDRSGDWERDIQGSELIRLASTRNATTTIDISRMFATLPAEYLGGAVELDSIRSELHHGDTENTESSISSLCSRCLRGESHPQSQVRVTRLKLHEKLGHTFFEFRRIRQENVVVIRTGEFHKRLGDAICRPFWSQFK